MALRAAVVAAVALAEALTEILGDGLRHLKGSRGGTHSLVSYQRKQGAHAASKKAVEDCGGTGEIPEGTWHCKLLRQCEWDQAP